MTETGDVNTKPQETGEKDRRNNENSITESGTADSGNAEKSEREPLSDEWMIRHSEVYKDEYKECKSIRGRFHQYFIFGESLDCSHWKADLETAKEWERTHSKEAYDKLIESEKQRRRQRLYGHVNNDIWEKRDSPPEEWKNPLPEWMAKNLENSYLAIKADEHEKPNLGGSTVTTCVIL